MVKYRIYLNPLPQIEGAGWIELTRGYYALLDNHLALIAPKFCVLFGRKTIYGQRKKKEGNGKRILQTLHQWVLEQIGVEAMDEIDHINGNGADNRINNLRPATHRQNKGNELLRINNTSGYRGVTGDAAYNKYKAQITVDGKNKFLGRFDDPARGGLRWDKAAIEHFGKDFAYLNFPTTKKE